MIRLVIGTQNSGKLLELRDLFKGPNYEVMSLKDFKNIPSVKEIGKTFEENAVIKASTLAKQLREVVLADDSGLVVPALKGEPGVHSARYAGDMASDQDNIQKLLQSAKALTGNQRNAYFQCVIAVAKPNGKTLVVEGRVDGKLLHAPRGNFGFGYDPSPANYYNYNPRRIYPKNHRPIKINIGYTIEPGVYLAGKFGARSEINFYIDKNWQLVITTPVQKKLDLI